MVAVDADAAVAAAVRRVTAHADFARLFKHPVKFDGTNFVETRLSVEEQTAEVTKFATGKLHVFLERYGTLLTSEDVKALSQVPNASTAEAKFWIERLLQKPLTDGERQKQSRRRRWAWARRETDRAEGFFSEDAMRHRDPQLFHHYVGRYVKEEDEAPPAPGEGKLSTFLLEQLDKECEGGASGSGSRPDAGHGDDGDHQMVDAEADASGARHGAKRPAGELDPEEMTPAGDEDDDLGRPAGEGAGDDAAVRRANFLKAMRERFVNGAEPGFEYGPLDEDSDLDDIAELGRDAEERYFDDE